MKKPQILAIVGVWVAFVFILAVGYKFFVAPKVQENREQAAANEKKAVITNTSATSRYKTHVWAFTGVVAVALPRSSRASMDTTGRPLVFQATVPGLYPLRAA